MRDCRKLVVGCYALGVVLLVGCSDNASPPQPDGSPDVILFTCSGEGTPCNAHDACAINPTCQNGLCVPETRQICDDGLDCTLDTCGSQPGLCVHTPKPGACVIGGACYAESDPKPGDTCQICDPAQSGTEWSDKNGGVCDDGDLCTKDDYCQQGQCTGTYYGNECADGLSCTQDMCNGDGTCAPPVLQTGFCAIGDTCVADGTKDAIECSICDVSQSTSMWTPLPNLCTIDGMCYTQGQMDSTGCGLCEPSQNATDWTPIPNKCLINGVCHEDGVFDATTCFVCDAGANPNSWTASPGSTAGQVTDFEGLTMLPAGWTATNTDPLVKWQVVNNLKSVSGTYAIHYGNPATGTYEGGGGSNSGVLTIPNVVLPAGGNAALRFNYWQHMESATFDDVVIRITPNGGSAQQVWERDDLVNNDQQTWLEVVVDVSAFAGQTVSIEIEFSADSSVNNFEGVYIDDFGIQSGCSCAAVGSTCQINGVCLADQTTDASGCRMCDANTNTMAWTDAPGSQVATTDFEGLTALPTGWTETHDDPAVKWQVVNGAQAASGTYALYYGDPVAMNYEGAGSSHMGVLTIPGITLPAGKKAALRFKFWHHMESATFDQVRVRVGGQQVWDRNSLASQASMQWFDVDLDISQFAGQTVAIEIEFEADSSVNSTEGAYIDDLQIHTNCP